ncbi:MAG TPA: DNA polymerase/3'-5' exonuclease PolX [Rhabdochlamydiaceae bacterium]|jgi:DNA polymerase (family 10)
MDKKQIARVLEEIAMLLELKAANPFRVRAYRNAARAVLNMDEDLLKMVQEERLTEVEGIGDDLAEKITALALKGKLPFYEKLKRSIPSGVVEMMHIQGLGGKKVKRIYDKLKITSIAELKKACEEGRLAKIKGFGTKTEQNILDALASAESYSKRRTWWEAMSIAEPILEGLKRLKGVQKAEIAGSLRRKLETVGDIDFLVASSQPKPIMHWFTSQSFVDRVLAKGDTKSSIRLKGGVQADLRIVPEKQFAFALCYFTGSKEHNIKLRERSKKRGWTLSEWGLTTEKGKAIPSIGTKKNICEADIYQSLGFSYIPPELRENKGEFEAASRDKLPQLVEEEDIRGTFHNHTTASDGRNTLKEMVAAAEKMGWEYIGIADHSKASFQANGLDEKTLQQQIEQIKKLNASKTFRTYIFAGTECDILSDGSLDVSNSLLKQLDYVIISIHSSLQQDEKTMTKRLIRAIEHPYSTMVGHLTGRLLLKREPYKVNVAKVIDACIANHKIIELNANPLRLDMDWRLWHAASEKGLLCCINTDAHSVDNLAFYRAGVNAARKGWLEKRHILNTRPLKQVHNFLKELHKK